MRVVDALVRHPTVHDGSLSVGEARAFFLDDHVHMVLIVDGGRLVTALERDDLDTTFADEGPASLAGSLRHRTIAAEASLAQALDAMRRSGRRRLAVTTHDGVLLGLLCLKADGLGFCTDEGVASRKGARFSERHQTRSSPGSIAEPAARLPSET